MMTVEVDPDIRRRETASWFARLNQRRVSSADISAFSAWRRIPGNAEAFDRLQTVWEATETLADDRDIAALTDQARAPSAGRREARARFSSVLIPLGAATGLAAVVAGVIFWTLTQPTRYETAVGEQRIVRLNDGSRITLDTASRVEVSLRGDQRLVTLVDGRALFDIERDPQRPFVVTAGDAEVTALGTRFDVRRIGPGARVILVEGRVAVRDASAPTQAWSLAPGQQLVTTVRRPAVTAADVPTDTSWTTGRLIFRGTPIREAVDEVNRYSRHHIDLRAPGVATIPVSGAFDAGDIDGFVAALTDLYPLTATRADDGTIVISASSENNS